MQKIDVIKIYQRKSALVIDDYPDMRGSIRRMLVNFGINELHTASSGSEAITACENNHYDIILCDYNLGDGKNGQQVLEELRFRRLLKRTTAYMMITAETTKSMVFGALEYQPDDYLTKPFTQTVLQRRLDRLVLEKEELREINRAIDEQDYDRAIALCDEQIDAKTRYEQKCYRIKANCFLDKHLYPQAREIFEDVLDERPVDWAQIGLGECMMGMGELDDAEKLYQELINQNCLCLEVYDSLAHIKNQRGEIASARLTTRVRQRNFAERHFAPTTAGGNQHRQRRFTGAEKALRKVVRLGANSCYESPENYFKLARCISAQIEGDDRKRITDAEDVLDRVRRRYRDDDQVHLQSDVISAALYANAGKTDESRKRLAGIQAKMPAEENTNSAQIALDLARCHQAMGDNDQAQKILQALLEQYPDDEAIGEAIDQLSDEPLSAKGKNKAVDLNRRGKELLGSQQYTEAIALFGEALRHYPNNIAVKLNLLLAMVRHMNTNGANTELLRRCEKIINSVDTLKGEHPLRERFQLLWEHVENLQEQLLEDGENDE